MEHIGINKTHCKLALLVGDPKRVDLICNHFGVNDKLSSQRGYRISRTVINEFDILVVSTGIGCPSLAIVVEELSLLGINMFLRIGTCGAIQENLQPGSIIMSIGAVRDEGTSLQYIDSTYPAIADFELSNCIFNHLKHYNSTFASGITHSKDSFYSEKIELQLSPNEQETHWLKLKNAGVLATDMETSCLFVVSSLRKVKSCSILVCVGKDKSNNGIFEGFHFILKALPSIIKDAFQLPSQNNNKNTEVDYSKSFLDK